MEHSRFGDQAETLTLTLAGLEISQYPMAQNSNILNKKALWLKCQAKSFEVYPSFKMVINKINDITMMVS